MIHRIERDHSRFRRIVRGKIKDDLKRYVVHGELFGRRGKDVVSIPVPQVELPRFRYGPNPKGGVGQGEGNPGDAVSGGDGGEGASGGGDQPGVHVLEVDVPLEELAEILGEALELPRIEPKGQANVLAPSHRYTGIRRHGPESLRHFKRTYKEALKRQVAAGLYDAKNPVIVPMREDRRYRSWRAREAPQRNAAILYVMDVSGSMGKEQKEIVRITSFWIDAWIRHHYRGLACRYIVHDAAAKEVDAETFYHLRESGGTKISSAYELTREILTTTLPADEWNLYVFQFSDGDNWSGRDTEHCLDILGHELLPRVNLFGYGQVRSAYGSGQFKKDVDEKFADHEKVVTVEIPDREGILPAIRAFLGKGR